MHSRDGVTHYSYGEGEPAELSTKGPKGRSHSLFIWWGNELMRSIIYVITLYRIQSPYFSFREVKGKITAAHGKRANLVGKDVQTSAKGQVIREGNTLKWEFQYFKVEARCEAVHLPVARRTSTKARPASQVPAIGWNVLKYPYSSLERYF